MNSQIIDLAVGLVVVFAAVTGLASVVTEAVSRFLGLRSKYLLTGLRTLLDDGVPSRQAANLDKLAELFEHPVLGSQGVAGRMAGRVGVPGAGSGAGSAGEERVHVKAPRQGRSTPTPNTAGERRVWRSLPSYIPARTFATAVVDLAVPDGYGRTSLDGLQEKVTGWPDSVLRSAVLAEIKSCGGTVEGLRASLESWYDDHMDRVSGWYKRYTARITLGVGVVLILLFNVNSVAIGSALFTDADLRTAVSTVASGTSPCKQDSTPSAWNTCVEGVGDTLSKLSGAGLPIGWGTVQQCVDLQQGSPTCGSWWQRRGIVLHGASGGQQAWHLLLMLLGFLATGVALVPGARFWFDALGRLGSLRSTGPKPQT